MATVTFAQIPDLIRKYEKRMNAVAIGSAQDVYEGVTTPIAKGGRMRVKTGFLRASFMASTSQMPSINPEARPATGAGDNSYSVNEADVELAIAGWNWARQTLYMGFTAAYAVPREYHDGFVRLEAQKWQRTVDENVRKAIQSFP